ncbi:MAG: TIGR00730 family Rossman fold protein [Treponemataceae bacterium]|nr:TIGR00730 family Rossman fold protein [Treponemataceae bacterium]
MTIAVYCGSGCGNDPCFQKAAESLGRWIGECGHSLVYGGGESGLMGLVAKNAKNSGAKVTGVIPSDVEFIRSRPQPYCDETVFTENMGLRKQKMFELADCFVALPGGIGTVDEISEVITLTKIGVFNKKSVLFNTKGFYDPFRTLLQKMCESGFLKPEEIEHVLFSDNLEEIGRWLA